MNNNLKNTLTDFELMQMMREYMILFEADVYHFYLDRDGYPTIGRGHLVAHVTKDVKLNLPPPGSTTKNLAKQIADKFHGYLLYQKIKGLPATEQDIINDLNEVRQMEAGHGPGYYNSPARLVLKADFLETLWESDFTAKLNILRQRLPYYHQFPPTAQLALVDMLFQHGDAYLFLLQDHPGADKKPHNGSAMPAYFKFYKAVLKQDWLGAKEAAHELDVIFNSGYNKGGINDRGAFRENCFQLAAEYQDPNRPLFHAHLNANDFGRQLINPYLPQFTGNPGQGQVGAAVFAPPTPLGLIDNAFVPFPILPVIDMRASLSRTINPLLALTGRLSQLRVTSFTAEEQLSRPFCYYITAYACIDRNDPESHVAIGPAKLLGSAISLHVQSLVGSNVPLAQFHGIINRINAGDCVDGWRQYTLELVPQLYFLGYSADCRSFTNQTALEIVAKLCAEQRISCNTSGVKRKLTKRPTCIQYQESTLNFISRLLEDEGIFYYFVHEAHEHILVLGDDIGAYRTCKAATVHYAVPAATADQQDIANNQALLPQSDRQAQAHAYSWERHRQSMAQAQAGVDYDHQVPQTHRAASKTGQPTSPTALPTQQTAYPAGAKTAADVKARADNQLLIQQANANYVTGTSDSPYLRPGHVFTLQGHPVASENMKYVITHVNHTAQDARFYQGDDATGLGLQTEQWLCSFKAVPMQVVPPAPCTQKPIMYGYQTAVVVGPPDALPLTNPLSDVMVRFHWEHRAEATRSAWARVAQTAAHKGFGAIFPPRAQHEVIVMFENGDIDRPVVVGSTYNGTNLPPKPLPDCSTQSGVKTCTFNGDRHVNYNELLFEDRTGEEVIHWQAEKNFNWFIGHNDSAQIANDQIIEVGDICHITSNRKIELTVGKNKLIIDPTGVTFNGKEIKFKKPGAW